MKKALMALCVGSLFGTMAVAQEFPRFTFNVGGGFTTPVEDAGDVLDRGWNVDAGAGINFHPNFGALVQFNYNAMGIGRPALTSLGFPDGDVSIWSFSLNPIVHTNPRGPVDLYFIGGAGVYRWKQQFTQPTVSTFTAFDPFFGVFYPVAVPATQVLTDYTIYKPGFNGGAGLSFGTRWNAKVYAEARFHRLILGNDRYVDMIPVTFGLRW
jgi:opacity protein-like surface antigen